MFDAFRSRCPINDSGLANSRPHSGNARPLLGEIPEKERIRSWEWYRYAVLTSHQSIEVTTGQIGHSLRWQWNRQPVTSAARAPETASGGPFPEARRDDAHGAARGGGGAGCDGGHATHCPCARIHYDSPRED